MSLPLWPALCTWQIRKLTQRNWKWWDWFGYSTSWIAKSVVFQFCFASQLQFFRHLLPCRNFTRHVSFIDCSWESCWWHRPHFADKKTEVLRNSVTCPVYSASKKACLTVKLVLFPLSIHTHSTALSAAANLASWMSARHSKLRPTSGPLHLFLFVQGSSPPAIYTLTSSSTSQYHFFIEAIPDHSIPNYFFPLATSYSSALSYGWLQHSPLPISMLHYTIRLEFNYFLKFWNSRHLLTGFRWLNFVVIAFFLPFVLCL